MPLFSFKAFSALIKSLIDISPHKFSVSLYANRCVGLKQKIQLTLLERAKNFIAQNLIYAKQRGVGREINW